MRTHGEDTHAVCTRSAKSTNLEGFLALHEGFLVRRELRLVTELPGSGGERERGGERGGGKWVKGVKGVKWVTGGAGECKCT